MNNPDEGKRLALQVNPRSFVEKYLLSYLNDSSNILDIGCGPGVIASEIANFFPFSKIYCIDAIYDRILEVLQKKDKNNKIFGAVSNIYSLPFESNKFDFIYSRFLFEYLKHPDKAVNEIIRLCSPGGRIWLQDIDGQLHWFYPEENPLSLKIQKISTYLNQATGFDPFIGRKLYHLLYSKGVKNINVKAEIHELSWGKKDDSFINKWKNKFDITYPIITKALNNSNEAHNLIKECIEFFKREDTMVYSVLFTVTGIKE